MNANDDGPKLDLLRGGRVEPAARPMDFAQENDGGITVALMSDLHVQITDREGIRCGECGKHSGYALNLPMFQAMDVGRRTIDMATEAIRRHLIAVDRGGATRVVPSIQVVQANLPKMP